MDTTNKKRLASSIVIITSVLLCSLASWFFTMAGASVGGGLIKWTEVAWTIWGIAWGAICGGVIAYLLTKVLIRRRRALYGLGALALRGTRRTITHCK